jgi:recombination protein RecT
MASVEATKQALQTKEQPKAMAELINASAKELGRALQDQMRGDRFARIALTNIRLNPKLLQCTPESFLGALFTAAALDLEPIAGRAYLIPFNNNRKKPDGSWHKVMECQFVMGYKGVADLFYRHEKALMLNWGVVKEGDDFSYAYGTEAYLRHRPAKDPNAAVTGYWVMAELRGGSKPFMYMSADECMAHGREHSKTYDKKKGDFYDDSPWKTNPESMCLKTVLIQLAKVLPLSVEVARALEADETSREFRKGIDNALDLPNNTNWKEPPTEIEAPKKKGPNDPGEPPAQSGTTTGSEIDFGE